MTLELCIESIEEARLAQALGIPRVELCSALDLHGLSPSGGAIFECCKLSGLEIHVMIRPRAGDFCYTKHEIAVMETNIYLAGRMGVHGVVFGMLDKNNNLDTESAKQLLDLAKESHLEVTFHRAFDLVNDPLSCLDQLIGLGFDRVLSSGQKPTAPEGIHLIKMLVERAAGRIQIMAGAGIHANNALNFKKLGVDAIHFTARKAIPINSGLDMGMNYEPDIKKLSDLVQLFQ